MKLRTTLALLAIVAAIGAYLYFFERDNPTTNEKRDNALHVVPDFDRNKIDSISIKSPETKIELRKKPNGAWVMEEPAKDRADVAALIELLTALETLQNAGPPISLDAKDPKRELKEYGVLDSTTKAKFSGGGKTIELILGNDTAVEGKSYLYVEGAKAVRVIANNFKAQMQKKADDFRDHRLADFGPMQLAKAEIKGPLGTIELTQKDKHWSITKPLQARGDDAKINDLLAAAVNAHVLEFGSDLHLATAGVNDARGTVTFWPEGAEAPVLLNIGQNPKEEKDKEKTWVRLSSRDALVLVPKSIEKILEIKPEDLRDHSLLRVDGDIVDRITIEPAGGEKLVLGRTASSWVRKVKGQDEVINDLIPRQILTDLPALNVQEYVSDASVDLAKYGLDQPSLKVTFSSFSSENTPESNAGDKPIVSVIFGKSHEEKVYAKVDDEPFIVAVSENSVNRLPKNPIQFQDLAIFNDQPEEVTGLLITSSVQPTLELERDKDKNWKIVKGEGKLDQDALKALVIELARLRAVRWVGPPQPEYRLDKPGVAISAAVRKGGQKVMRELSIGANQNDLWYSSVEGREGVFQIGAPIRDILAAPLTDKAAAANPPLTVPAPLLVPGSVKVPPIGPAMSTPATPLPATPAPATPVPVPATPPAAPPN